MVVERASSLLFQICDVVLQMDQLQHHHLIRLLVFVQGDLLIHSLSQHLVLLLQKPKPFIILLLDLAHKLKKFLFSTNILVLGLKFELFWTISKGHIKNNGTFWTDGESLDVGENIPE